MTTETTIGERYTLASEASDLSVRHSDLGRGSVDYLIAAGWVVEGLGTRLYRLMAEFDSVRADINGQAANVETERLLVLMKLKSLGATRDALGRFAQQRATIRGDQISQGDLMALTGRVLDVFLDPNCGRCDGRGVNGGYGGTPRAICKHCGGTGKRRHNIGKTQGEKQLADHLLSEMSRRIDHVDTQMRRYLRNQR